VYIVAIPELGTSVGIGSFSGEQLDEREQEFRRMKVDIDPFRTAL
jgi:hypothetical protein